MQIVDVDMTGVLTDHVDMGIPELAGPAPHIKNVAYEDEIEEALWRIFNNLLDAGLPIRQAAIRAMWVAEASRYNVDPSFVIWLLTHDSRSGK